MELKDHRPVIELVPTESIRFHEHPERSRTLRLVERLRRDQYLQNPPIVTPLAATTYLLLDGANRVSAFLELGLSHTPVQVIDYGNPSVQLKGWHHLLLQAGDLDLRKAFGSLAGVSVREAEVSALSRLLELREVYAVLVDESGRPWGLFPQGSPAYEVHHLLEVLEKVVAGYEGKTRLERVKLADYSELPDAVESVEHKLVLFPVLSKSELLQLAHEGAMIPTGISRHIIPGRTLGLNLDLDFLTAMESDAEKRRHFKAHYDRLLLEGRIRYYEESVFILNE